jgi:cyclopropane-fatty-acyl-phospholipid synthase
MRISRRGCYDGPPKSLENRSSARQLEMNAVIARPAKLQHDKLGNLPARAHHKFPEIDHWLLQKIYRSVGQPQIRLRLGDRLEISPESGQPVATIVIRDRGTLVDLCFDPEVGFGEGYRDGRIVVEGDLVSALEAVYRSEAEMGSGNWSTRLVSRCMAFVQRNSLTGARQNIHRHYDLSNDFFRLWLDEQLVYSCAYFATPSMNLDTAQVAKMDYICRKLNLRNGEHVLDIGCGWGALALHMAKYYGVRVRGFTISREQVQWARERAQQLGLSHLVEFVEDDYRNIVGQFDAVVSVGMLEHVGPEHYQAMGKILCRSLGPGGRGVLQSVGRNRAQEFSNWTRLRIFPGACAPSLRQIMNIFEPWDCSILDVENLRHHYARTSQLWLQRFENSANEVCAMFDEEFVRTWRLYLAGTIAGFRVGTLQLFQIVFSRDSSVQPPGTRARLYQD